MGCACDKAYMRKLKREIATAKFQCDCSKDTYDVCKHTGDETCKCVKDRVEKYCGPEMGQR